MEHAHRPVHEFNLAEIATGVSAQRNGYQSAFAGEAEHETKHNTTWRVRSCFCSCQRAATPKEANKRLAASSDVVQTNVDTGFSKGTFCCVGGPMHFSLLHSASCRAAIDERNIVLPCSCGRSGSTRQRNIWVICLVTNVRTCALKNCTSSNLLPG